MTLENPDPQNNDLGNNDLQSNALPSNGLITPAEPAHPILSAPAQSESVSQKIFLGADGLRAGWSLLLFVIILGIFSFSTLKIVKLIHPPGSPSAATQQASLSFMIYAEVLPFVVILFFSWLMSKIEGRRLRTYGLGKCRFSQFFAGVAWGVVCLSLLVFTLCKTGLLVFDSRLLSGGEILGYGFLWFLGFLFVGLFEEYLTRGYLQYTLSRGLAGFYRWAFKSTHSPALGFWTSALIFSFLFGMGHSGNPGESPIGVLSAGLIGLIFCLSLWRTGSLWWAIGFHAAWDWAQSFIYGVADSGAMVEHHLFATHPVGKPILSGGATGPEGSVYVLAVLFVVVLIILFTLPRTRDDYAALMPVPQPINPSPQPLAAGMIAEI